MSAVLVGALFPVSCSSAQPSDLLPLVIIPLYAGGTPGNMNALLQSLMGGGGLMGGGPGAPPPVENPAEAYASQLQQLSDMGFYDRDANIRALQATGGNVNAAVERLLSGP